MKCDWLIDIPEGRSGDWSIERFTVCEEEDSFGRMRAACNPSAMGRFVPPGKYTALKRGGKTIRSTTPDELRDFRHLRRMKGSGLIAGLGLGCAVTLALRSETVDNVTVVEVSPDVIKLVGPALREQFGGRLRISQADIFDWRPTGQWGWAYYDIWDDLDLDNLPEMSKLKRKFARRIKEQSCWAEEILRSQNRREKRYLSTWR